MEMLNRAIEDASDYQAMRRKLLQPAENRQQRRAREQLEARLKKRDGMTADERAYRQ
jgi:hypothetical protein